MKNKLLNKILLVVIITVQTVLFCGCGSSFELTNEESKLVAEYAAGILLKHSANYSGSLVKYYDKPDDELVKRIEESEQKKEEKMIAEEEAILNEVDNSSKSKEKKADTIYTTQNIADSIGLDGFEINYSDYLIVDTYPENSTDMAFTLDASEGKHLLVLRFDVNNVSGEARECDVLSINPLFRIVVNDKKRINEQQTILMDDLKQLKSNISTSEKAVLIFEIDDEIAGSLERIDLTIKSNGEQSVHKIL